ncbi:unnamed protein product [Eruca vesicaria subsp. sativa]|uniref:Uncharacterized protein n=1 Tax=Eruca vesicaria subsp. sativa TaxID=29727 RepID=A0ABC8LZ15_ERUVS|nr:unnamed protein product [Eruca vesicaria subsp. sativa]
MEYENWKRSSFNHALRRFENKKGFQLYRTTKHKYTIKFNEASLFRKIEPVNGSKFLCCANFRGINRGVYHPVYCIEALDV